MLLETEDHDFIVKSAIYRNCVERHGTSRNTRFESLPLRHHLLNLLENREVHPGTGHLRAFVAYSLVPSVCCNRQTANCGRFLCYDAGRYCFPLLALLRGLASVTKEPAKSRMIGAVHMADPNLQAGARSISQTPSTRLKPQPDLALPARRSRIHL